MYRDDRMNKFFLISISLFIFIIGIGCAAAADLDSGIDDSCGLGPNDHVFAVESVAQLGPNDHVYAVDYESQKLGQQKPQEPEPLAVCDVDDSVNVPVIGGVSSDKLGQQKPPVPEPLQCSESLASGILGPNDHVYAAKIIPIIGH